MNKRQLLRDLFPFTEHLSDPELDQFIGEFEDVSIRHVTQRWRGHAEDCSLGYRENLEWSAANAKEMITLDDLRARRPGNPEYRKRLLAEMEREVVDVARGDRIRVQFGGTSYDAIVTEVRGERVFVTVDPDSDAPIDTFYHRAELGDPA